MTRCKFLVGIGLCVLLVGCGQATLMKMFTPPEVESQARTYVEQLRQGKFDQIEHDVDQSSVDSNFQDTLAKMAALFPDEAPESIKVVGAHTSSRHGDGTADITLEYQFPSKWLLVSVATQRLNGVTAITGIHVAPVTDSLENLYSFTLFGKSGVQYLILALTVCSLLFSLYVCVLCARTKIEKRKWFWVLFTVVGVGRLGVNWTTGQWAFTLLAVSIPSFRAYHSLYSPWIVEAYFPLGAIFFLNKRWQMRVTGELIDPPTPVLREGL
jgi:hypothetical protein